MVILINKCVNNIDLFFYFLMSFTITFDKSNLKQFGLQKLKIF